jgi:hypothetical protein
MQGEQLAVIMHAGPPNPHTKAQNLQAQVGHCHSLTSSLLGCLSCLAGTSTLCQPTAFVLYLLFHMLMKQAACVLHPHMSCLTHQVLHP